MSDGVVMLRYELFGLTLESEIERPGLATSTRDGAADIMVRLGAVTGSEGLAGTGDHHVHRVPDVAAYRPRTCSIRRGWRERACSTRLSSSAAGATTLRAGAIPRPHYGRC